ncbi:NAD-dependent succinate-semialdehyde dehydrogenase [Rhizorhabdus wittichii]|uniref:Succinate semialdehyde dehydrogenase n=2 Tax=Rhizorhabdus wittichii TaxID=160791 RepID=A0A9J9HFD2_RHIWR|nr:NAD-dependent succinate-semialdehyde dehydrogenase [Rhizorhabdus wittichii]ABQ70552.1 succinate semialdehyde dehydrogenase [Rhizorhabdus wittichii RW1]QTH23924.1 NAD-dependent succinate-semialdehyde dehydrogenase [Rhizorhabdus wittichii]
MTEGLVLDDPSLLVERCLIGGRFVGDPVEPVVDPATGRTIARVPRLGAEAATAAVEQAQAAFPAWAARTAKERATVLRAWFEQIRAHRADLALILTSEQGKPLAEALGEIDYAAAFVEYYAEEAKRVAGETLASHRADARILVTREPIGVIGAITPWNFPAAMITRKVAPALAVGCTALVKPAPETPLTALALGELAVRAGLPPGVLNIVTGDAAAIGAVMTGHPAVRVVSFTGSTEVGRRLMAQAAPTVKRVALELGGNAPFIVFDDADLDAAVEGAIAAKFRNMGQTCVCANRLYVQDAVHDAFASRLATAIESLQVGPGTEPGVAQGPLINARALAKVEAHVADAVAGGATVALGGRRHPRGGTFYAPTLLIGATPTMRIAREETFGPVAALFRFTDEEEVIAQANASETGLAAYVYTRDLGRAFRVSEALEYGMVGLNTGLISTELAPFGGVKQSGHSREGSHHGLEDYCTLKYVLVAGLRRAGG